MKVHFSSKSSEWEKVVINDDSDNEPEINFEVTRI